jgi:hypothetical protein
VCSRAKFLEKRESNNRICQKMGWLIYCTVGKKKKICLSRYLYQVELASQFVVSCLQVSLRLQNPLERVRQSSCLDE